MKFRGCETVNLARGPATPACGSPARSGPLRSRTDARLRGPRARFTALLIILLAPGAITSAGAQQKVPLVLHHLIITVDSATYADVVYSPFIRDQFSTTEPAFLTDVDGGPGIRLMGKYNFLQVALGSILRMEVGDVGIVLASEHPGGLERIKEQGEFRRGSARVAMVPRNDAPPPPLNPYVEHSDRLRPAGIDAMSSHVEFELLQYTIDAANQQFLVDSSPATNFSNSRFLSRFYDPKRLLSQLTAATLAVPVDDIAKIVAVLKRNGTTVYTEGEGAIIKLDGFTLHLIPPWSGAGVKQLQFALTRDVPANPVYTFGPRSRLRFGPGPIAVWDFNPR